MKKFNKLFALLLALSMVFALAACSSSSEGESSAPAEDASQAVDNEIGRAHV